MAKDTISEPTAWLTAREVAERAGVTVFTVAKWVRAGKLAAAYEPDGRTGIRFFDPTVVAAFLDARADGGAS